MGAYITVTPAARAFAAVCAVLASIPVLSMTSLTPLCKAPPSVVKSFWYSIRRSAVVLGSMGICFSPRCALDIRGLRSVLRRQLGFQQILDEHRDLAYPDSGGVIDSGRDGGCDAG